MKHNNSILKLIVVLVVTTFVFCINLLPVMADELDVTEDDIMIFVDYEVDKTIFVDNVSVNIPSQCLDKYGNFMILQKLISKNNELVPSYSLLYFYSYIIVSSYKRNIENSI